MTIPSTNYTGLHYVLETLAGVTPASPGFQSLPTVSGAPQGNISTAVSKVLRRDRQIDDLITVDSDINGSIDFELTYGPYSPLIRSLLQGAVNTVNIAATDIGITIASSVVTLATSGTDLVAGNIKVGQNIKLAGFATSGNNVLARVTAVAAHSATLDVGSATIVTEAAGASVTIKGTMMRNGVATPDNYTFLRTIEGVVTPVYMYYRGCQIGGMTFDFATGQILGGKMDIVGLDEDPTTSPLSGQTITDVAAYALMNSVSSITKIAVSGLPSSTKFQSLNLSLSNNISPAKSIGKLGASGLASFTLEVTGEIKIYFEDLTIYNTYKNSGGFLLSFTLQDALGNVIVVTLPRAKFESMQIPPDGKDNFLMLNGKLRGTRDTVTNCMVQFDFFPAP